MVNAAACQDWWSQGLNVNPYEVDETHGEAAYVDFTVPAPRNPRQKRVIEGARKSVSTPFDSDKVLQPLANTQ